MIFLEKHGLNSICNKYSGIIDWYRYYKRVGHINSKHFEKIIKEHQNQIICQFLTN